MCKWLLKPHRPGERWLHCAPDAIASHRKLAMVLTLLVAAAAAFLQICRTQAAPEVSINVTAFTPELDSDWSAVYYSGKEAPILLGNDASADKGGFRAYSVGLQVPLEEINSKVTGRTKLVTTVYDVDGKDLAITIAQPTSLLRAFELPEFNEIPGAAHHQLGDWSALCPWKSRSGNQYVYLFGKNQAVQYLLRTSTDGNVQFAEVGSSDIRRRILANTPPAGSNIQCSDGSFVVRYCAPSIYNVCFRRRQAAVYPATEREHFSSGFGSCR